MCAAGGADDSMSDPNLPPYTPTNPDRGEGTVGDPFEGIFCDVPDQNWNVDLWRAMNMDSWLSNRYDSSQCDAV